jgi:HemK-like putative methylase
MPRLPPQLFRLAGQRSPHLAALLRQCRSLRSAENELRWLKQHVNQETNSGGASKRLDHLVRRRAQGEPLQYILGNQPFGDLEILCKPRVLIPRPETETYTIGIAQSLKDIGVFAGEHETTEGTLRILDLCSGTGCISLLLHDLLRESASLQVLGLDLSQHAVQLAKENIEHNIASGQLVPSARAEVRFHQAGILDLAGAGNATVSQLPSYMSSDHDGSHCWDVLVSNPPYVSPRDYNVGGPTEDSVRKYEPRMALVPPRVHGSAVTQADEFYPHILRIARAIGARLVVMEVGDAYQAQRVCELARAHDEASAAIASPFRLETWYDDGTVELSIQTDDGSHAAEPRKDDSANARAIVMWKGDWATRRAESLAKAHKS